MTTKLTTPYVKRQIRYFTKRHDEVKTLGQKLDYSKRITFWESKLKEMRK